MVCTQVGCAEGKAIDLETQVGEVFGGSLDCGSRDILGKDVEGKGLSNDPQHFGPQVLVGHLTTSGSGTVCLAGEAPRHDVEALSDTQPLIGSDVVVHGGPGDQAFIHAVAQNALAVRINLDVQLRDQP